jgi:hypothetical protein
VRAVVASALDAAGPTVEHALPLFKLARRSSRLATQASARAGVRAA